MSEHTQGPWQWRDTDSINMPELINALGEKVCDFGHGEQWDSSPGFPPNDADSSLIAAAPEMWDLIEKFGGRISDLFEQLEKGGWRDDHGHPVRNNTAMLALIPLLQEAIAFRAKTKGKEPA